MEELKIKTWQPNDLGVLQHTDSRLLRFIGIAWTVSFVKIPAPSIDEFPALQSVHSTIWLLIMFSTWLRACFS